MMQGKPDLHLQENQGGPLPHTTYKKETKMHLRSQHMGENLVLRKTQWASLSTDSYIEHQVMSNFGILHAKEEMPTAIKHIATKSFSGLQLQAHRKRRDWCADATSCCLSGRPISCQNAEQRPSYTTRSRPLSSMWETRDGFPGPALAICSRMGSESADTE